ncbi:MAG TPA: IPT/TIG domain-containing protein, partial [Myxococcota bacterium]|nr:IPT/TIG domain-containing protein [Myxococcota bacterium]
MNEAGPTSVIATNGFEQRTLERAFTYEVPVALTTLEPTSGPSIGGTLVTLRGRGLSLDHVVRFG